MPLDAGWLYAAALLLGGAGVAKVVRPEAVTRALTAAKVPGLSRLAHLPVGRISGVAEVLVAAFALSFGNRAAAALVAAAYLVFAAVAARLLHVQAGQPCGCFGEVRAPVSVVHVVVDLAAAAAAASAVAAPPGGLLTVAGRQPLAGVPFIAATLVLTWLAYLAFTALPTLLDAQATARADAVRRAPEPAGRPGTAA